jgi:hypothetical protein
VTVLYLHETHKVVGEHASRFEGLFRDEWMGKLAEGESTRLLWYLNHAMGSGPSYQVVTITALADGDAWEDLARRLLEGDLKGLAGRLDACRYEAVGKLVTSVEWSAMQDVDLGSVPSDGREHELSVYMHDTGWPDAPLDDYIELWDRDYWQFMRQIPEDRRLLDIVACFQVAHGTGIRPEAILMQKIDDYSALGGLLTSVERYDPNTWPGSYMAKGLEIRDQWESKLLRASAWSPFW